MAKTWIKDNVMLILISALLTALISISSVFAAKVSSHDDKIAQNQVRCNTNTVLIEQSMKRIEEQIASLEGMIRQNEAHMKELLNRR